MILLILFSFIFCAFGLYIFAKEFIFKILELNDFFESKKITGTIVGVLLCIFVSILIFSFTIKAIKFDTQTLKNITVLSVLFLGIILILPWYINIYHEYFRNIKKMLSFVSKQGGLEFQDGFINGLILGILSFPFMFVVYLPISLFGASRTEDLHTTLLIMLCYLPFLVFLFGFHFFKSKKTSKYIEKINSSVYMKILGLIYIAIAVSISFNLDKVTSLYVYTKFPKLSSWLIKSEEPSVSNLISLQNRLKDVAEEMETQRNTLPNYGTAPKLLDLGNWINTDYISQDTLNGKVVLVDFWSTTCLECINSIDVLNSLYDKYKGDGLVVLGITSPRYTFEDNIEAVKKRIEDLQIRYPVALDNEYVMWNEYKNIYFPAIYLIDRTGNVRFYHLGSTKPQGLESAVLQLLGKNTDNLSEDLGEIPPHSNEMYFGIYRIKNLAGNQALYNGDYNYINTNEPKENELSLNGGWNVGLESAKSLGNSILKIKFNGSQVYAVIEPTSPNDQVYVYLDDKLVSSTDAGVDVVGGRVKLDNPRIYHLINMKDKSNGVLRLEFKTLGTLLYEVNFN